MYDNSFDTEPIKTKSKKTSSRNKPKSKKQSRSASKKTHEFRNGIVIFIVANATLIMIIISIPIISFLLSIIRGYNTLDVYQKANEQDIISKVEECIFDVYGDVVTVKIESKTQIYIHYGPALKLPERVKDGFDYDLVIRDKDEKETIATGTYRDGYYESSGKKVEPTINTNYSSYAYSKESDKIADDLSLRHEFYYKPNSEGRPTSATMLINESDTSKIKKFTEKNYELFDDYRSNIRTDNKKYGLLFERGYIVIVPDSDAYESIINDLNNLLTLQGIMWATTGQLGEHTVNRIGIIDTNIPDVLPNKEYEGIEYQYLMYHWYQGRHYEVYGVN